MENGGNPHHKEVPEGYELIFRPSFRSRTGKLVRRADGRPFPMIVRKRDRPPDGEPMKKA